MIAAPSGDFTATVQGFATGLAADVGATIISDAGATVVARATGATEHATIPGLYLLELTAPATEDHYIIDWDDDDGNHAYDDLYVVEGGAQSVVATGNLYVTATALKASATLTGETFADDDVTLACSSASRAVDAHTGRRFWLDADATQVRYYTAEEGGWVRIDDLAVVTSIATDLGGGDTYATVIPTTDYFLEPYSAPADGRPWTRLSLRATTGSYFQTGYPHTVKVTGKFGWPAVPAVVAQATMIQARRYLARRNLAFAIQPGADGTGMRIPFLDPDVQVLLKDVCRRRLLI